MDFKLRYHASVLGYVWAILKPLLLFAVMNFVFSNIFNFKNNGTPYYSLELLTGLLLFNFFAEGTTAGIASLVSKAQLVTKIYVPRWIIVVSSTVNSLFVFLANLVVLFLFFVLYHKVPSIAGILMFIVYISCLYMLVVATGLLLAPLYVRFRDIGMIWEVLLSIFMYASPIVYPLTIMPPQIQKIILLNPLAFVIYFGKQGLIQNHFSSAFQTVLFLAITLATLVACGWLFRKTVRTVAEYI